MIAWIDVETTGIDYENDNLLEIAMAITDDRAEEVVVYEGTGLIEYSERSIDLMRRNATRKVEKMHSVSGLWDELKASSPLDGSSVSTASMDMLLVDFIAEAQNSACFYNDSRELYLGGTSTLLDRMILNRDLPMTASMIHYHSIDTSTLETVASVKKDFPIFRRKHKLNKPHRALDDVMESIEAYRHYLFHLGLLN